MASAVARGLAGVADGWHKLEGKYLPSRYDGGDDKSVKVFLLGEEYSGADAVADGLREYYQFSPDKQVAMDDTEVDLHAYKKLVRQSALDSMITAVKQVVSEDFSFCDDDKRMDADRIAGYKARSVKDAPRHIWNSLERIWEDSAFQEALASYKTLRDKEIDRAHYYFNNVMRVCASGFIPTIQDVVMCRRELNGVMETPLLKNMWLLEMPPVQSRSQVKQVAQFVTNNTVVVYCVDVSTFDLALDDRAASNQLRRSFEFFKTFNSSPCMKGVPVLVILTNRDALEQKLHGGRLLASYFPKYKGENDSTSVSQYFIDLFASVVEKHRFSALILPCKRLDSYQDMKTVKRGIHNCVVDIRSREAAFPVK